MKGAKVPGHGQGPQPLLFGFWLVHSFKGGELFRLALDSHQEPARSHLRVQPLLHATLGLICPLRHICQWR